MNIVDGRKIAEEIKAKLKAELVTFVEPPTLIIVTCAPNLATTSYLELKQKSAESLGIKVVIKNLPPDTVSKDMVEVIKSCESEADGIIVQLPLPEHIDTDEVLNAISPEKDVDVFGYHGEDTNILPPVVGAIEAIAKKYEVKWAGKEVVIFGAGRLVGEPAFQFAQAKGAKVRVINIDTNKDELLALTREADIIILGVGKQGLLTVDMVKPGVVVFDAGASEDGGLLVGDADPSVAEKALLFTPVPGGIGPITIAVLFRNLLNLTLSQ